MCVLYIVGVRLKRRPGRAALQRSRSKCKERRKAKQLVSDSKLP